MTKKYQELKEKAIKQAELNGHKLSEFIESGSNPYASYGKNDSTWGHSTCIYCKAELHFDIFPRRDEPEMSGTALENKCLSIGKTIDETGIAVTTWAYCRKCDKKLNVKSKHEMKTGFHKRCQDNYLGAIVLEYLGNGKIKTYLQEQM